MKDVVKRPMIQIRDLAVTLAARRVIESVSLDVFDGEIVALIGASGGGKTVLLRTMLGLLPKTSGTIDILGLQVDGDSSKTARSIGARSGVLFQQGALFSSLTVRENVEFPMREYLHGSNRIFKEIAMVKLQMAGFSPDDCDKMPSQLSGGMTKRAALARALALDPEILFLDEPSSGLDPIATGELEMLIKSLHDNLKLTVFMITHDVGAMRAVCNRVIALHDGKIIADGPLPTLLASDNLWLKDYFHDELDIDRRIAR
jgi:phospholipid/cholesterol/gamma-HCH transport system ATP-binding protein